MWVSIKEIFAFLLGIALIHKPSLVLLNSTIRSKLLLEHPLTTHRFTAIESFSNLPSPIWKNGVHLTLDNFFQSSASGDAYSSTMDVGVSSTRYTVKSSPKKFSILYLLLLLGASLSSFSRTSSCDCSEDSVSAKGSGTISEENLEVLCISFIGNIFSKDVASRDSITVLMHVGYIRFNN